jgi:hypothetical protein
MMLQRQFNNRVALSSCNRQVLRREGASVGENRVARIMREWSMRARVVRVYHRMTKRRDHLKALPNYRLEAGNGLPPHQIPVMSKSIAAIISLRCADRSAT